jgi:predicted peptidase
MKRYIFFLILLVLACSQTLNTALENNPYVRYQSIPVQDDKTLQYILVLPEYLTADRSYPVLLILPPGGQTESNAEWAIKKYLIRQSIQKNWIVVSPLAPAGVYFHEGAEVYIPVLMDTLAQRYNIEGNKFHLAGISNGGISAFHLAVLYTGRILSLTVFPGVPPAEDYALLSRLTGLPVTLYVGEHDSPDWINEADSAATILQQLGGQVTFKIFPGEEHVIDGLTSEMLFNLLDGLRL